MRKPQNRVMRVTAAVMAALALATTAAEAIDLRSWDQKISNVNQRFVVLGAVPLDGATLAVQGDCDWKSRDAWEPEFDRLLRTMSVK